MTDNDGGGRDIALAPPDSITTSIIVIYTTIIVIVTTTIIAISTTIIVIVTTIIINMLLKYCLV